jgi:hypothetical protein
MTTLDALVELSSALDAQAPSERPELTPAEHEALSILHDLQARGALNGLVIA